MQLKAFSHIVGIIALGCTLAYGQAILPSDAPAASNFASAVDIPTMASMPKLAPELALAKYRVNQLEQSKRLEQSLDRTIITAELPDTKQSGHYELTRTFTAQPRSLTYATVQFQGDSFVKTNVITKFLQSEVDHVQKGDSEQSALTEQNYKFSYKGLENVNGFTTHVYQVKPRKKRPGLFKGRIYLDAYNGNLRRMEGSLVKSPSFFVKSVEFVQDFADIQGFTMPTVLYSSAKARIIGRTLVNIVHKSYEVKAFVPTTASAPSSPSLVPVKLEADSN